jgi:hypothetical protein
MQQCGRYDSSKSSSVPGVATGIKQYSSIENYSLQMLKRMK